LELGNECDLYDKSYDAGWHVAELIHGLSPRHILVTNSFWGYWISDFYKDPQKGHLIDYSDQHYYSQQKGETSAISNVWDDSTAYVRECHNMFNNYRDSGYNKPIVRGEGGVALSGTGPQHSDSISEETGVWYHKKLWAHVGTLGFTCDGEWYPRLFVNYNENQFPNSQYDTFKIYSTYDNFIQGEFLNNGNYEEIGTDLDGNHQILLSGDTGNLRAFGSRDKINGSILLWVDNSEHTWKNVVDGKYVPSASGTIIIQDMPSGTYQAEWWNTRKGTIYSKNNYNVGDDGLLSVYINNLDTDLALKFHSV
jgi:hypothetical protein